MKFRCWPVAGCWLLALTAAASADTCTVNIGNGTADVLVSVTVRAEFAPPGSEADRNLPLAIAGPLAKGQSAKLEWPCPSSNISYVATGTFANDIKRASAPFTPRPSFSGAVDTAWIE
ncbi:MAG: hypothetical protein ACLQJR_35435 [Stellaceae bacterium]